MRNREEVCHAVLPHVLCRADAMATTIAVTIPAVIIYVNLGLEVAGCDAIAKESIPALSAPGEGDSGPKGSVIGSRTAVHDAVKRRPQTWPLAGSRTNTQASSC
jgi:hypothetical protein